MTETTVHIVTLHSDSHLLQTTLPRQGGSELSEGWIHLHNAHAIAIGPTPQAFSWIRHRKSWSTSEQPSRSVQTADPMDGGPKPVLRQLRRTTPVEPRRLAPARAETEPMTHPTQVRGPKALNSQA